MVTVTSSAISGTNAEVLAAPTANAATPATIAGLDAAAVTLVDGNNTFTVDQVNAIAALTTGAITATVTLQKQLQNLILLQKQVMH